MGYPVQDSPSVVEYNTEINNPVSGTVSSVIPPLPALVVEIGFYQAGASATAKFLYVVFDAFNAVDAATKLATPSARRVVPIGETVRWVSDGISTIYCISDAATESGATKAVISWGAVQ